MRRWLLIWGFGSALALIIVWMDLPFSGVVYNAMMHLRGPQPANRNIVIVSPPVPTEAKYEERYWIQPVQEFLKSLTAHPPRVVGLDFELDPGESDGLHVERCPFPVLYYFFYESRLPAPGLPSSFPLVATPEELTFEREDGGSESQPVGDIDLRILREIAPDRLEQVASGKAQMINVAGPPGTYIHISMEKALADRKVRASLEGKILLISPPPHRVHAKVTPLPFFPKGGVSSSDATEIHANVIDTVLRNRGIRIPSPPVVLILTLTVTLAAVGVLFGLVPVLGVFAVILLTVLLVLGSLAALNKNFYLDIAHPATAIIFAYYFLIPYRLIVEYKGRWRYQQENKLLSEVETLKDNFMSLVSHNLKTPI
ncbi:MAG TPA: hypothetical protein VI895_07290, partial [Bdellovibrionota bacterium]|nr:hypothetical protein [Bdellovibrionota bacterium]